MKRVIFAFVMTLLFIAAADKPIAPDVQVTLEKALDNERHAVIRYKAFAERADQDGYPGAVALFRAMAQAEQIHAARFAAVLYERGAVVPPEPENSRPLVGSTATNLRTAATGETSERDGIYRDAINVCQKNNDPETAKVFDETRDVEVEHANLSSAAAKDLDSMKQPHTYYICDRCGYTTDLRLPLCPDCLHKDRVHPAN